MKPILVVLLCTASSARGHWLRWSQDDGEVWVPQETKSPSLIDATGWTPRPTPPPGFKPEDQALGILRRNSEFPYLRSDTCGWYTDSSCE